MPQQATSQKLRALAARLGPDRVLTGQADRRVMAHDASHFLRIPRAVITALGPEDVAEVLAAASDLRLSVTFRSGGTSLSGQGTGTGILLDTRAGFKRIEVLDGGARVRVQPGATVRAVNNRLARFRTQLGPDPASEIACTIGGVIANNSSGMSCGTEFNTYQTLESLEFILPSGTRIDSADVDADATLKSQEPGLYAALTDLRARILGNPQALRTITSMYAMKNTMGYGLNSLVDFSRPIDILVHLLVGSEGTLGFVSSAVFATVPAQPYVMTGLLIFDSLGAAAREILQFKELGATAVELMDATSLRVAQGAARPLEQIKGLDVRNHAAVLVEFSGPNPGALKETVARLTQSLDTTHLASTFSFTADGPTRTRLWELRKGLYTLVAGARPAGTTALLEDVVVPISALAHTCIALEGLFAEFGYRDAVIFGHAKDGNIHFMLTDDFADPAALDRFSRFTEALVELILGQGGSLKAEHGTGTVMAPFVKRQYGPFLYQIMTEIKAACDPAGVMNPGVILTSDPTAHLKDFKPVPRVHPAVNTCVECGYCEPVCPSKDLTLTPRQRIVLSREIAQAEQAGDRELARSLKKGFTYEVVNTCAVDGMCQTTCPLDINTGDLVRTLRHESPAPGFNWIWTQGANHYAGLTAASATMLSLAHKLPQSLITPITKGARRVLGADNIPMATADLPRGGTKRSKIRPAGTVVDPGSSAVFIPSCQGAMFAAASQGLGAQEALQQLCTLAGVNLIVPAAIDSLCCGTPWKSKGNAAGQATMSALVLDAVQAYRHLDVPVITDSSSCAEGFAGLLTEHGYEVVDPLDFVAHTLLPLLPVPSRAKVDSLTVHPTCSTERLGSTTSLLTIARAVAHQVNVPEDWGCCAFAGDRGMLHPELTASATQVQAGQVKDFGASTHASSNRACEVAMTRATGFEYQNIVSLLAAAHGLS